MLIEPADSRYRVDFDGKFHLADAPNRPPEDAPDDKACKKKLAKVVDDLDEWQRRLYAHDHHAVLLVFQAMDAAGKDSTIRAVLRGINPAGCQVFSFKQPSKEELDHHYLWRTTKRLPERGRIGVFNRSYYEEVLVVRVHPEYLKGQRIDPASTDLKALWQQRYAAIQDHERDLSQNGTLILKFFLNVSYEEQRRRFLSRLNEPEKHWKFSVGDVNERRLWPQYMQAYEAMLRATSRPWAPWYAIPADNKRYMRWTVARIVRRAVRALNPTYPTVHAQDRSRFDEMKQLLSES